jgi:5-methylcytosine-specific restriction protein A
MRSPPWTREEVMLALEIYLGNGHRVPNPDDPAVLEVSKLLNELPIHPQDKRAPNFRNPAGVVLKIANLRALDPSSSSVGMARGSKIDQEVWDEFAHRPNDLYRETAQIRRSAGA